MASSSFVYRGPSLVRAFGLAFACCAAVAAIGCEKADDRVAVYPVTGKVLFKGQPAVGATVVLSPTTPLPPNASTPTATVQADGTFKTSTYETADGAPEGEYKVTVVWYKPQMVDGVLQQSDQNVIPAKYASPNTTPEIARVAPGSSNVIPDIVIK